MACAGGDANISLLQEITDFVIVMKEMTPDTFDAYFTWMSDSIAASVNLDAEPPALPQGLNLRKPLKERRHIGGESLCREDYPFIF